MKRSKSLISMCSVIGRCFVFWRSILVVLLPLALLPVPLMSNDKTSKCAYVALLMAFSWMLELLPLAVTALIPVAFFPIMGIMTTDAVSKEYMRGTCMLFVGGLIMAIAVEQCQLHRRIALNAMRLVGTSPRLLILGFMLPTAFLSMWISNTATTAMMIPIMEAVMVELQQTMPSDDKKQKKKLRAMLAMSVCMSANIGGTGTTIGTGPNLVFVEFISNFPGQPISFGSWMAFAVPQMVLCLAIVWVWLQLYYLPWPFLKKQAVDNEHRGQERVYELISSKCKELGPMSFSEWIVLVHFIILVLLWFFRSPGFMPGYGDDAALGIKDATPAIATLLSLFLMPSEPSFLKLKPAKPILDWKTVEHRMPWGIILLLGGGFAMAQGSEVSGLSAWLGDQLSGLDNLSPPLLVLVVCLLTSVLTQVASNSASASILVPIMLALGRKLERNPLYLMMPPTLVCSYAFMLPVSTPPNAIAFGPSGMSTVDMMKVGTVMNIACIGVTMLSIHTYGYLMFNLDEYPSWVDATNVTVT